MAPAPPLTLQLPPEDETIYCKNCVENVGPVHIECAECEGETVTLCLECFSCGAECGSHDSSHSYHVRNTGGVVIFSDDTEATQGVSGETSESSSWSHPWVSSEEILLLDQVERYNLGNWEGICQVVNPQRSVQEVKEHYDQYYLRGRIGQCTVPKFFSRRPKVKDHSGGIGKNPEESLLSPPIRETVCKLNVDDLRLLAYMPRRDDFEKEWNNDAEQLISGLLLMPDDDDLDKAVKLAQVDMYMREVSKRRKRKAIARDYDLVPKFFKQEKPLVTGKYFKYSVAERLQMKSERDLREKLKKITQFMTHSEFEDLCDGITKANRLRERIEELQKLRKNGIKTLEEGGRFLSGDDQETISPKPLPLSGEGSLNSTLPSKPNADANASVSTQGMEKPAVVGTDSEDGKRKWPSQVDKATLLSRQEKNLCIEGRLEMKDYLMIKMAVFKEYLQRKEGASLRTNIRQDTLTSKELVSDFLKEAGWLPLIG